MGMYTEFHLNVELKKDTPKEVIDVLSYMASTIYPKEVEPPTPKHVLFTEDESRWRYMMWCDSYYFPMNVQSEFSFDDITNTYFLSVRCNLKNYTQEIQKFVDWLTPYIDEREGVFIGFMRYEEDDDPTLLYHPNKWVEVDSRGGAR